MPLQTRPPWSHRRRRLLLGLALGGVLGGLGAVGLPDELGVTAAVLAALCGFLLIVALVVFVAIPGPDTVGTLLDSVSVAGAATVVAVLLLLSTPDEQNWLWTSAAAVGAIWTATAIWRSRRPEG